MKKHHHNPHQDADNRRLFIAVGLAALLLFGWQSLVEWPRRQTMAKQVAVEKIQQQEKATAHQEILKTTEQEDATPMTHEERIAESPRLLIHSDKLEGSIALKGARFDDLLLAQYRETLDKDSPEVTLFLPSGEEEAYFAQLGWVATDGTIVPDQNTLWKADTKQLSPGNTTHLKWDNGHGVTFILAVSLDTDYMFHIEQRVENHSGKAISVAPYGYINRTYAEPKKRAGILHEGPLGVMQGSLTETTYKELREKNNIPFEGASGWFGITDKYWMSALIPDQSTFKSTFSHYTKNGHERYQVDYLAAAQTVDAGASDTHSVRMFAGAKEGKLIDHYARGDSAQPPIPLFDRAVDYGMFYLIAKPLFQILNFFYQLVGNFGVAILLLTILVKLALFPLANKSYHSMAQMRQIQPEMAKLREKHADDRVKLQQETMALYKRAKVNPAAGCLPLIIQIPVFFALYRVLLVSIEMRQAPFYGWIHDLSAQDPSNLFTLFGMVPWNAPIHLGFLPMFYCATMVLQMSLQPAPPDPVQARMMKFMPYFLLFIFASMPAGLLVYWIWSNMISIIQQQVITRRHKNIMAAPAKAQAKA